MAMAPISADQKYRSSIVQVPAMYAVAMMHLGADINTAPDGVYQLPKNHANLILPGFEQIIAGFCGSLKDTGNEISEAYEKFWSVASIFFVLDNSELVLSKDGRRNILPHLHSFMAQSTVLAPDQVDSLFPFASLKVYLPTVQIVTSPGAKSMAAAREDDMAI